MEAGTKNIIFEVSKGIAVITLNRPETMNAFTMELVDEIDDALTLAEKSGQVKILLITGAGKGFTTGGDLSGIMEMKSNHMTAVNYIDRTADMVRHLYNVKKPVIAAVNGFVYGAGIAFMMACDIIIASEHAQIGYSFSKIGFCPDSGATYFLIKKVGYNKAAEILFFGKTIAAEEALQSGLVNQVVSHEELMPETMKTAEKLAKGPLVALMLQKRVLRNALSASFEQNRELESVSQIFACQTDDFKEGISALTEKRIPAFTGR